MSSFKRQGILLLILGAVSVGPPPSSAAEVDIDFTLLSQTWQRSSNYVFANCPPVCTPVPGDPTSPFPYLTGANPTSSEAEQPKVETPVSPRFKPSLVTGVDLETGLEIDRDSAARIPTALLHRVEKVGHTTFVLDEYALIRASSAGVRVERASSATAHAAADKWGHTVASGQGVDRSSDGHYLIVHGMEHLTGERRPMVKFRAPGGSALGPGEQVVVRAVYSMTGALEVVETLAGSPARARDLMEGVELVFLEGSRHRVALYAVFQGGDRPELTAAIPTFLQCCCDGFLCPG